MSNDSVYNSRVNSQIKVNTEAPNPLDRVKKFASNIVRGAHDTGRSYTSEMYDSMTDPGYVEPSYRDATLMDVGVRGAIGGDLHGARAEAERRYKEEPGRIVGEVAAEAGIAIGTMGAGSAFKGFRTGMTGIKSVRAATRAQGQVGWTRKTGIFKKGGEHKFIGTKRTEIRTINHKGKTRIRNKRTGWQDILEKGGISMGEKLGKSLGRAPKMGAAMVAGASGLTVAAGAVSKSGFDEIGGTIGARITGTKGWAAVAKLTGDSIDDNTSKINIQSADVGGSEYPSGIHSDILSGNTYGESLNSITFDSIGSKIAKVPNSSGGYDYYNYGGNQVPSRAVSGLTQSPSPSSWNLSELKYGPDRYTSNGVDTISADLKYQTKDMEKPTVFSFDTLGQYEAFLDTDAGKNMIMKNAKNWNTKKKYREKETDMSQRLLERFSSITAKNQNLSESSVPGTNVKIEANDNPIMSASAYQDGMNYEVTFGNQPAAISTSKDDVMSGLVRATYQSETMGDSFKVGKSKVAAIYNFYNTESLRQKADIAEEALKYAKINKGQGQVMRNKYDFDDNLLDGTPDELESIPGYWKEKTIEPVERSTVLGTDPNMRGVSEDGITSDIIYNPLGQFAETFAEVKGTRVESTAEYTGITKVISGGQTGVDQSAIRSWYGRGGITGGTMPSGFVTEKVTKTGYGNTYTAAKTQRLGKDQIFVYGANKDYLNYGGAAGDAAKYFGAGGARTGPKGGPGIVGQSYGVITKIAPDRLKESYYSGTESGTKIVTKEVKKLISTMKQNPDKEFVVTEFGTKMAGFKTSDIVKMFGKDIIQPNAVLPKAFVDKLSPKLKAKYFKSRKMAAGDMEGSVFAKEYGLTEGINAGSVSKNYAERMTRNVIDGDGTIIFGDTIGRGTSGTIREARDQGRPLLINPTSVDEVNAWARLNRIDVVNIAGTRSTHIKPGSGIIDSIEYIVGNMKKSRSKKAPEGYRDTMEKLYINTSERFAGSGKKIKQIASGPVNYTYSGAVNASGKGPRVNTPRLKFVTNMEGKMVQEEDSLANIRAEFEFQSGRPNYDPTEALWNTSGGISKGAKYNAAQLAAWGPKSNPTGLQRKMQPSDTASNRYKKENNLYDVEEFRSSLNLQSEESIISSEFEKSFNSMNNPIAVTNNLNWRNNTINTLKFNELLRNQRFTEMGKVSKKEKKKYPKGMTFGDMVLEGKNVHPDDKKVMDETAKIWGKDNALVKKRGWDSYFNREIYGSTKTVDPKTGKRTSTSITAEAWIKSVGITKEQANKITVYPTDKKGNVKKSFNPYALVFGKPNPSNTALDAYVLKNQVAKFKETQRAKAMSGKGLVDFPWRDTGGNNKKVRGEFVKTDRNWSNINYADNIMGKGPDRADPFAWASGSPERKAAWAIRRKQQAGRKRKSPLAQKAFYDISTPVIKIPGVPYARPGNNSKRNFYERTISGDSIDQLLGGDYS